ncbi:MAG: hypothetical protein HYR96_15015 [Deltaproteobacteria bacterium]|nr:hypothetical protein [Deltaproteobacteria bacterium]MBI3293681.1 hypothetical protein [Deltaproteobacteria bacterium]
MKLLPPTDALLRVAQRMVWFKPPTEAIANGYHFVAHVLTYGTHEDVSTLRKHLSEDDLKEAIVNAPPGVFDTRSWAYWNLMIGRYPAPPLPERKIP